MYRTALAAAALGLLVSSCAHQPPPAPAISLAGKTCAAAPNVGSPLRVDLAMDKVSTVTFDDRSECMDVGPNKVAYTVFTLPSSAEPFLVSVDSVPFGVGLFAPALQLLDSNGAVVRDIPRDSISFHGAMIHAGFRAHPGETYLVISSDPQSVGQQISKVMDQVAVTAAAAGPVIVTVHTGSESIPTFTYTLNGTVNVVAYPMPKAKRGAP